MVLLLSLLDVGNNIVAGTGWTVTKAIQMARWPLDENRFWETGGEQWTAMMDPFGKAGWYDLNDPIIASTKAVAEVASPSLVGKFKVLNAGKIGSVAAESTAVRWGPATGAGPLGSDIAATFRGASYTQTVTTEATTLYRAYGGTAGEIGGFWTRTAPTGSLQFRIDAALAPQWGNTAELISTIRVPSGTIIFEGFAAPQGSLLGGGNQIFIDKVNPSWLIK